MMEENAAIQACDVAKEDPHWAERKALAMEQRIRKRSNCQCICELAEELLTLDRQYKRLEVAIKADPKYIPDSQKALWPEQFKAMNDYKTALKKRIIDLINTDN